MNCLYPGDVTPSQKTRAGVYSKDLSPKGVLPLSLLVYMTKSENCSGKANDCMNMYLLRKGSFFAETKNLPVFIAENDVLHMSTQSNTKN